jgi:hypothetical protein
MAKGADDLIGMGIVIGTDGDHVDVRVLGDTAPIGMAQRDAAAVRDLPELRGVDVADRGDFHGGARLIARDMLLADAQPDDTRFQGFHVRIQW